MRTTTFLRSLRTLALLLAIGFSFTLARGGAPLRALAQSAAADPDAATVDAQFRQLVIAMDYEGAAALFSDDATIIAPFGTYTDHASFVAGLNGFLARTEGLVLGFDAPAVSGNTATHRLIASSDVIRAQSLDRVILIETLQVENGRIVAFTSVPDLTDAQTAQFVSTLPPTGDQP
jgi:hypothetical protein